MCLRLFNVQTDTYYPTFCPFIKIRSLLHYIFAFFLPTHKMVLEISCNKTDYLNPTKLCLKPSTNIGRFRVDYSENNRKWRLDTLHNFRYILFDEYLKERCVFINLKERPELIENQIVRENDMVVFLEWLRRTTKNGKFLFEYF
jgi:hypothetical protein